MNNLFNFHLGTYRRVGLAALPGIMILGLPLTLLTLATLLLVVPLLLMIALGVTVILIPIGLTYQIAMLLRRR